MVIEDRSTEGKAAWWDQVIIIWLTGIPRWADLDIKSKMMRGRKDQALLAMNGLSK
jgi:hypothetical protein